MSSVHSNPNEKSSYRSRQSGWPSGTNWMEQVGYGQNPTTLEAVERGNFPIDKLEKESARILCKKCRRRTFTRVESRVSNNGRVWAVCCGCFGIWPLSFLVLCMDVFREFIHYCPSCNSIAGKYRPPFSGGMICLFILITVGVIAFDILVVLHLIQSMQHSEIQDRDPYRG